MNLYQELGVAPTATIEEIKRAYRSLARYHHPDYNKEPGAAEKFKAISFAFEILGDAERRKRYDETGATSNEDEANVTSLLAALFTEWMASVITSRRDPGELNMIAAMQDGLQAMRRKFTESIAEGKRQQKIITDIAGRISVKEGQNNLLREMALAPIKEIERRRADEEMKLKVVELALAEIRLYGYDWKKSTRPPNYQNTRQQMPGIDEEFLLYILGGGGGGSSQPGSTTHSGGPG